MQLTYRVLADLQDSNSFRVIGLNDAGEGVYLCPESFSDHASAQHHVAEIEESQNIRISVSADLLPTDDSVNVVDLNAARDTGDAQKVVDEIGEDAVKYAFGVTCPVEPGPGVLTLDKDLPAEAVTRIAAAVQNEVHRVLNTANRRLLESRKGMLWLMRRAPGSVPPRNSAEI